MGILAETIVGPTVDASDLVTNIKAMLSSVFTVDNLVTIILGALSLSLAFVIFWFGYRFISRKVVKAMKKGSL